MRPPAPPAGASIGLPPEQFAAAFPFHVATDSRLTILQVGATLARICPDVRPGGRLDAVLRPVRPAGRLSFDWIVGNRGQFFLLEHLPDGLQLRGEFVPLPDRDTLLFLGSPWFTDSAQIASYGLRFDDFAIHDPVVDLLQVFQASKIGLADASRLASKLTAQRAELRAANERLRQQEAEARRLALIAARTDNAVILADATGCTVWVNEGFTRMTGYTLSEVAGRTPGSVLQGPGTDPATVARIGERLRRGEGFNEEILNYHKDGREYWIAVEVQPLRDEAGRVTNFMAIESDVTERRAAQQRLAIQFDVSVVLAEAGDESAAIGRVLQVIGGHLGWAVGQLWSPADGSIRCAGSWTAAATRVDEFVQASRAVQVVRGEGLIGRVWAEGRPVWIPDVTRDAGFRRADVAARVGLRTAFALPVLVRGEAWGVLEFLSTRVEQPADALLETFATVGRQIGQFVARRDTERALRDSEDRLRLALEATELGTWDLRLPEGESTQNERYFRMLGYEPGEVDASYGNWWRFLHPDDAARAAQAFDAHLRGQTEVYDSEHRMRHKSGAWVWVQDRGQVVERDAQGDPVRVCGTRLDITARKQTEQNLREEKELLEQARRRELATGHEIQRTLLIGDLPAGALGADFACYAEPSQGVHGDFFAFTTYRPDCLELLVGDVMGKGVPAALIGAAVRTAYNQTVTELLSGSLGTGTLPSPADVVNALHRRLTPRLIDLETFATLALYRFDLATGRVAFVNAGHTPGLLQRRDGQVRGILGANLPLGVRADEHYVEESATLLAGDALVTYSDGITEARNADGEEYGDDRLERLLAEAARARLPADTCLQALRKAVRDFAGTSGAGDDQTAVVVSLAPASAGNPAPEQFALPWRADGLGLLRQRVAGAAQALGPDAADGLVLAAFEVATNIVRHVPQPFPDATLTCRIVPADDRVTVELWHLGPPFQPPAEPLPDFSGASEGGFGLYIIHHTVAEVAYDSPIANVCRTTLVQTAAEDRRLGRSPLHALGGRTRQSTP